ncbi:MAG: trypsin-like peptidase domain-containing protein [Catenulispora sp.]
MPKRTAAVFAAAVTILSTALLTAGATAGTATAAAPRAAVTLASTIALDDCSASLVRYPTSQTSDRALMLTAGHCFEGGMPAAGQVLQNVASSRSGTLLGSSGNSLGTVRADKLLYATMTNTDVAVYELTDTFASITSRFGATALTISASHASGTAAISIPSGYWNRIWTCSLNGFANTVREDQWTWHDSLRYGPSGCDIIGGSSGSPVVDSASGTVVGVNNTINESGQMCTLDNPCEVNSDGTTTATKGQGYGQETYWLTTCLTPANTIDLTISGCLLTKPPGTGGGTLTNGGFEAGSLAGWTSAGTASVSTAGPHSGGYAAQVGSTSPSTTSSISQTFTAPSGSAHLTFWYSVTCPDTITYDWATATLKDNTAGTTATVLAKTCTNGAGWKQASGTVTAGHSYTLTLTNRDDNYAGDATYTRYDDVTLS